MSLPYPPVSFFPFLACLEVGLMMMEVLTHYLDSSRKLKGQVTKKGPN